jgi:hypothetical protein
VPRPNASASYSSSSQRVPTAFDKLDAEAGKVYFIRTTVLEITAIQSTPGMELELNDNAEGQFLVSSSALSTPQAKKELL